MSVVAIFFAVSVLVCIFAYIVKLIRLEIVYRKIPSPPAVPLAGHLSQFKRARHILADITKITHEHNGFVKMHVFHLYSILITNYKYVEELLSTTKILSKSREYDFFGEWLGSGLLTSEPVKWKKTRKIITPTFHFKILEQFIDVFNSASEIFVDKLKQEVGKKHFDVYPYVTLCTLDVICETAMGTSVNAQKESDSKYVKSVQDVSRIVRGRVFSPKKMFNLFYYFTSNYKKEKQSLKIIHGYTNSVIQRRKDELEKLNINNNNTEPTKKRLAFLDLLLQSTIDGRPMTSEEIRQEVDTFMFEGHDTTASAIAFAMFCLSNNFEIQERAVRELQEIFNHDKTKPATYTDLQNMKYLEMIIKETLRLYPSVPMFGRKLDCDFMFGEHMLPKGTALSVFAFGLHRDPAVYPDPEKFDPERFSQETQSGRNAFSYVPFSAGPRNCIGQKFAMLEMKSTLSRVLRNYEILPVDGFKPILVPDVILKSINGVEISLRERLF